MNGTFAATRGLEDFQRNAAFVAFMLIVCFGVFVFITRNLRETITPLCWAAFFAVPSTLLISYFDRLINAVMSRLVQLWHRLWGSRRIECPAFVHFVAVQGDSHICLDHAPGTTAFLRKVNTPCIGCGRWLLKVLQFLRLESYFRRRVKIVSLSVQDGADEALGPEVNRLVQGWTYYVSSAGTREFALNGDEGLTSIRLELFLDASEHYAAVVPTRHPTSRTNLTGTLEMDKSSSLSWFLALILTLLLVSGGMWFFIECINLGVQSFTANLDDYKKGVEEFLNLVKPILPPSAWKELQQKISSFISDELTSLASELASALESLSFQALMFFVYLFFWIFEPLPVSSPVAEVFKSYLLMKTFICLLFSTLMSVLLLCLQCKIWSLFFVLTFLLNFIPEIGAIASAVLTVPAILFDGHLTMERRLENLIWLVIMGTAIKVFTGNVVEVQMYATMGGQFMRMHPVIIMALIMLFSSLLGVTGMFLAVPSMAAVKYYLVSTDMPEQFQHPLLIAIEGDATGPHKNFVDQQRIQQQVASNAASALELTTP
ncbi:unnamed protein product [Symbiodinium pilosum]|uniref:Uncharacterized protein n=1 Tax=Symbiodinium pilosum TaxID=2952 RepID=A0A812T8Q2_SYMPI|nr:unnamed protein product [Symbiodinium pilosum]